MHCPKRIAFFYHGMYARTQLAVIDHNPGTKRKQSRTKDGKLRYNTVYFKVTSSWVERKIMGKKEKAFINDVLEVLFTVGITEEPLHLESTTKIIAKVPYPGKKEVIPSHSSRFL